MYDIIVVGGGPAGLTAALYSARAGKKVLVLEGENTGGQINLAPQVDNYPGLPSMSGADFGQTLTRQAMEQGAEIIEDQVLSLRPRGSQFEVTTSCECYSSTAVILATGVTHRKLNLPGEDDLVGAGISYCAVCDGAFYQNRPVAVVGGGDTALQDALFLSERCSHVTLIHRRDLFRGTQRLVDQLRERDNVTFLMKHTVEALHSGPDGLTGLTLLDQKSREPVELTVDGLFVAVGQKSQNGAFSTLLMTDDHGYLLANENCAASLSGVFAAGDCRAKEVRQLATAVGDGATAALAACKYVDSWRTKTSQSQD